MNYSSEEIYKVMCDIESKLDQNLSELQQVTEIEQFVTAMKNCSYRAQCAESKLRKLLPYDTDNHN